MEPGAMPCLSEPVTIGDYILKSKLGESSFSTIWKAESKSSGEVVAVKQVFLSKLNKHLTNCLDCELNFLSSVNHPNIIRLLHVFQFESCLFLVLEFCAGGDLASYIRHHGRVQEQIARRFMQQLGAGLEVLQSLHIIHRDLKPENILLSGSKDDLVLKIADFGLSRCVDPGKYAETVCGSPLYMAPEVLQFQRYDEKVDMWSLGAILFELLNGYPPFHGRTNVQLLQNIKSCTCLPFSKLILPGLDPDCVDICSRLLSVNPVHRLSFQEFYQHKFLEQKEWETKSNSHTSEFECCRIHSKPSCLLCFSHNERSLAL
ncbi:serine/threonine-protein kinase ATG1t [Herrania umbratica]|uniref:Serine/threonine-protein kinase ATG1t n=1 Tax=Herrania umbratica TaxID=108875 RepID=A0A6J1BRQ5_9ROSI|nr:serine/threonine-protein kinase ATG1t [Herrania umbratica]XP_021300905.1 serine/threonine-protein kinase ATG1t [Herrania umbratica]